PGLPSAASAAAAARSSSDFTFTGNRSNSSFLYIYIDISVLQFTGKKLYEAMSQESLLWVGPALLFSTATAISVLGWDGKVRTILSIRMPNAAIKMNFCTVLFGALNDRLLLANLTKINLKQKRGLEISWRDAKYGQRIQELNFSSFFIF
ncbi:hypothetical protein HYC85_003512, partial [Camellia sinensis]